MNKKYTTVMEIQKYRVVKTEKGTYRIQYKKKRSFCEFIRRKSPWKTICIDFPYLHRLKAKLYFYAYINKE